MSGKMFDLTISARIYTTDGECGRLTNWVLDPESKTVTHLVMAGKDIRHTEHLVPIELVLEATPQKVLLRGNCQVVHALPEFTETEYRRQMIPYYDGYYEPFRNQPAPIPVMVTVPVKHRLVPPGELAVDRRARVKATDGQVGRVDEFVVDASNGDVTQLLLRQGHLWAQRDVAIPAEQIARIAGDTVYLSLDKQQVEDLPHIRPPVWPA
jgi:sporulation protein YlmC with PRC-barrel domain